MPVPAASKIAEALAPHRWPEAAVQTITGIVRGEGFAGVLDVNHVKKLVKQTGEELPLVMLHLTAVAALYAVPPISDFYVGAVVRGKSGKLYFGCNMEFEGLPLSFSSHAEQNAVVNAWVHGERGILSVAVNAAPCGYCRQYLYELSPVDLLPTVILASRKAPYVTMPLTDLLPLAFGPADLGIDRTLLDRRPTHLKLSSDDPVVEAALAAADLSYAPYTKSYSGVALDLREGPIVSGPLSENAAYNPSQSPLQAALFLMNMAGYEYDDIAHAVLVEAPKPVVSQREVSTAILRAVAPDVTLDYVKANFRAGGGYLGALEDDEDDEDEEDDLAELGEVGELEDLPGLDELDDDLLHPRRR